MNRIISKKLDNVTSNLSMSRSNEPKTYKPKIEIILSDKTKIQGSNMYKKLIKNSNSNLNNVSINSVAGANKIAIISNIESKIELQVIHYKYKPTTRFELKKLIEDESIYLGDIYTGYIADMDYLFYKTKCKDFSGIEYWDMSNVLTAEGMFYGKKCFNSPIGCWDVSKLQNASYMFYGCANFNQSLNDWDISSLENAKRMFNGASNFNQPLDRWDITKIKNSNSMFSRCGISITYQKNEKVVIKI